jgi:2-polyprenyl-3-methyl-5-hydroxy-6-metoxy-1,4-benzoquinol methylase
VDERLPDTGDFVGPSGNATAKYASRNPLTRALLNRFLRQIDEAIEILAPSSILDVGCGEGVVTERLARLTNARTVGIDLATDFLRSEWQARERGALSFQEGSAYDLAFADGSFDCVCALEVLEHLERPRDALAELVRVASRALVVSVPNEPMWRVVHLLAGRDVRQLGNTPGHVNHWSSKGIERLVSEVARVEDVRRPFPWTIVVAEPGG